MTRSKPASASSPETGGEPETGEAGADGERDGKARPTGPIEITFEVSPQRTAGWLVFEVILGALLIWKLGTVGTWVGVVLLVHAAFRAGELAELLLGKPGTLAVDERQVTLPRGRSGRKPLQVAPAEVSAVYFLRRSVPWNHAAPVLVVELGPYALAYPRDWFATEADQRHLVHALMRGRGAPTEVTPATLAVLASSVKLAWVKLAVGVVLFGVGIALWLGSSAPVGTSSQYTLFVAPIIAGVTLIWRWLTRL